MLVDLLFDRIDFFRTQVDETGERSSAAQEDSRTGRFAADSPMIEITGICGDDAQSDVYDLVGFRPAVQFFLVAADPDHEQPQLFFRQQRLLAIEMPHEVQRRFVQLLHEGDDGVASL